MKKETVIEWLINELESEATTDYSFAQAHKLITLDVYTFNKLIEQAKAMEKEQHFELYKLGNSFLDSDNLNFKDYFDQYYNETYEK